MKNLPVIVKCPACDCPVEADDDLEVGDCVVCDQCDEALEVVGVDPLELAADEEDVDDDLYDDEIDDEYEEGDDEEEEDDEEED